MAQRLENKGQYGEYLHFEVKAGVSWRLLLFALFTFLIAVFAYLGLEFGYKKFLDDSIAKLDADIKASLTRVGDEEQANLVAFNSQIVNLKKITDAHVFGSNIFDFIEKSTGPTVTYGSMSLSIPKAELTLDGVADSYSTLAAQAQFFEDLRVNPKDEKSPKVVDRVVVGSSSKDEDGSVKLNLKLTLNKDFFDLKNSIYK